jgi:hypothetical protein
LSLYVKTIKVKTPVATGDQTVTCLGFKPKVIIAHGSMTPAATPNTLVDEFFFHFGAYAQRRDGQQDQMAIGDWAGDNGHGKIKSSSSNVKLVYLYDADGLAWEAAVTSVSDAEVVINWTNLPDGATERDMFLTCWGGGDIQDSMVKSFVSQAGGSFASQATTGVGFQPTGILFFSQGEGSDAVQNDTVIHSSIGFAASATQQASMGWSAGSVTSQELSNSVLRTDRCISRPHGENLSSHALDATFSLSSFDSDGFTGVWADNDSGRNTVQFQAYALCIKGPQFQAVNDTQPAAAGTSSTTTTFPPGSGLFMSIGKAAASAIQGHTRISLGSGNDSGDSGSHFGSITHQAVFGSSVSSSNSDVKSITAVNRVIQNKTQAGTPQGDARLVKMNPDKKIDLAWPNADSTARQWAAFVIGGSATESPLQWTSNSHIDRKFHLTGTVAGDNTVWTLPITDETIDTVVLGPDFGDLEGTVVSVTTDGTTVTATGSPSSPVDYSGGVVVVGRSYVAEIELTRPFLTNEQKNQITNAGLLIHKMAVNHSQTGEYIVRVEQPNRTAREQTFTPLDGSQIEAVGTRQYIISGNAKDTTIKIRNTTPKPSTIVGVEYTVTAIPRSFI